MKTEERFSILSRAAEFIEDHECFALLESLRMKEENREYSIPIIGQFSAGKSKLINRLIEKDVLPVKTLETTAVPTYVSYADEEYAVVEYVDGHHEKIDISLVKEWWNIPMESRDPVESIHVFLPASILSKGIVFVDTPGVNTLIERHVKMTEEILESALYVIYVMNGQVTGYDKTMIDRIREAGITIVFARTHADNMKSQEKNPAETIAEEKRLLGNPDDFFVMCNDAEKGGRAYTIWKPHYEHFKSFLFGLSDKLEEIFSLAIDARLEPVRRQLKARIDSRIDEIDKAGQLSEKDLRNELDSIQKSITLLEKSLEEEKEELSKGLETVEKKCVDIFDSLSGGAISSFKGRLNKISGEHYSEEVSKNYTASMSAFMDAVGSQVNAVLDKWERGNIQHVRAAVREIDLSDLQIENGFLDGFDENSIQIYEEREEALISQFKERLYAIDELSRKREEELALLGIDQKEFQKRYDSLAAELEKQQVDLDQLRKDYTPRYYIKESRWSKRLKVLGDVADVALLLVPGPTWANAGAKCAAKGAEMTQKGSRLAKAGGKAMTSIGKAAEKMAKADKILDAAKIAKGVSQNVSKKGDKETARMAANIEQVNKLLADKGKGNILDYLSLSFWFEKAGEIIDPTHTELDQEYQDDFEAMNASYQEEIRRISTIIRKTQSEISGNRTEIEQKRVQIESLENRKKSVEEDFKKEMSDLQLEKERKIKKLFFDNAIKSFENRITDYRGLVISRVDDVMSENNRILVDAARDYVKEKIDDKKIALEDALSRKASSERERDTMLNQLRELTSLLDGISN